MYLTQHIFIVVMVLFSMNLGATEVFVASDRDPVSLDESFQLVFSATDDIDDDPDFKPLEKDFEILGTQQSSQISIINGKKSSEKKWIVSLLAKHSGDIHIPAISFGKDKSQPVTLTVKQSGDDEEKGREVFIEVETSDNEVYVQQELGVTVRLYRSIATANASLSDLAISGVNSLVERLAEGIQYHTKIDGNTYQVFERQYVVFPQASGELVINQIMFRATKGVARLFADPFGEEPRSIIRRSESININVKPVPDAFAGKQWLPAKTLELEEMWTQEPPVFRVGEPVTRTIRLTGRGVLASQLPEISMNLPEQLKAYPDQPVLESESSEKDIIGVREEKIAIIPSASGHYVLPEIRIPYWSVQDEATHYATLPERTIEVLSAITGNVPDQPQPEPAEILPAEPETANATAETGIPAPANIQTGQSARMWPWLSAGFFIAWILTLYFWWRSRKRSVPAINNEIHEKSGKLMQQVESACRKNDPVACKRALLDWAATHWREQAPRSLGEISARLDNEINEPVDTLNNVLYGNNRSNWDGGQFWQAFHACVKNRKSGPVTSTNSLEPMFKIS